MGVWRVAKLTIPPTVPLARPPPLEDVLEEAQYRHSRGQGNNKLFRVASGPPSSGKLCIVFSGGSQSPDIP